MTPRIWLIGALALLAACGEDDDAGSTASTASTTALPAMVPFATTASTTTASTTTVRLETSAPTTTAVATTIPGSCWDAPAFDLGGGLRDQFVDYLAACGFNQSEAACLFDHLDFEDPAVVAGEAAAMVPAFDQCRIDVDRMAEIANESQSAKESQNDGGA